MFKSVTSFSRPFGLAVLVLSSFALAGCPKKISSVSGSAGLSSEQVATSESPSSRSRSNSTQPGSSALGNDGNGPSGLSDGSGGEAPISAESQDQASLEKDMSQDHSDSASGNGAPSHEAGEHEAGEPSAFVVTAPGAKFSENVYFDFDKWLIRSDTREVLGENALWLTKHSDLQVKIEGHGDERGSNEYNLALGERRARSARRYLINLGVNASRISFISYGEEKGVCDEKNEDCYQKNRRAHFFVKR